MEGEEKITENSYEEEIENLNLPEEKIDSGSFSSSRKNKFLGFTILLVALVGLIWGNYLLIYNVKNPFAALIAYNAKNPVTDTSNYDISMSKDTDGDGLTDYEEINTYQTSPYLADTDSDELSDKEEVDRGRDPNCPGQGPCEGSSGSGGVVPSFAGMPSSAFVSTTPFESSRPTAAQIRQVLIAQGYPQDQIDQFSDQDLLDAFDKYVVSENTSSTPVSGFGQVTAQQSVASSTINSATSLNASSLEDLKKLTGAQIRQLMIKSQPSSESALKLISDDELKTMFISQLEKKINSTSTKS